MTAPYKGFTHSWIMNEYMKEIQTPPMMRRIDRFMVGEQVQEFNLANAAKREFVNNLERFATLFRISEFPMDRYVELRGRYILTIWRIIEDSIMDFRKRAAMPNYANSLEWWAGQIELELKKKEHETRV